MASQENPHLSYRQAGKNDTFETNTGKQKFFLVLLLVLVFIGFDISSKWVLNRGKERCRNIFYDHDFKKNLSVKTKWGEIPYHIITNSLGFRDKERRKVDIRNSKGKHRILFIGDSFVEGVGVDYEKTFTGLLDGKLGNRGIEILNAGVCTYSPKLYYLKVRYLINKVGLKFNELYVFIDISDIQDDIVYGRFRTDGLARADNFLKKYSLFYEFLRNNVLSKRKIINLFSRNKENKKSYDRDMLWGNPKVSTKERGEWAYNEEVFEKWGQQGLSSCEGNMDKLYRLCKDNNVKITIAVYPWPEQILNRDLQSRQVTFWKEFSEKRDINFINYFPGFIDTVESQAVVDRYFIKGDVHWNENGNRLIADTLLARISYSLPVINSFPKSH